MEEALKVAVAPWGKPVKGRRRKTHGTGEAENAGDRYVAKGAAAGQRSTASTGSNADDNVRPTTYFEFWVIFAAIT